MWWILASIASPGLATLPSGEGPHPECIDAMRRVDDAHEREDTIHGAYDSMCIDRSPDHSTFSRDTGVACGILDRMLQRAIEASEQAEEEAYNECTFGGPIYL